MRSSANTYPGPLRQSKGGIDGPAASAAFRAWEPSTDHCHMLAVPQRLIVQLAAELAKSDIVNALAQFGFRQAFHIQAFDTDDIEASHQGNRRLVHKVAALVRHL